MAYGWHKDVTYLFWLLSHFFGTVRRSGRGDKLRICDFHTPFKQTQRKTNSGVNRPHSHLFSFSFFKREKKGKTTARQIQSFPSLLLGSICPGRRTPSSDFRGLVAQTSQVLPPFLCVFEIKSSSILPLLPLIVQIKTAVRPTFVAIYSARAICS